MQSGLVSVMMPAYNAQRFIRQAVESVLAQKYPRWELVVVDDGSTDETPEILKQLDDTRIKVIHQSNGGESTARNAALGKVQGEFLAFLDADDAYLPSHLQDTVSYLKNRPNYGGVYTDGFYCDEQGRRLKKLSARRIGPFEGRITDHVIRSAAVFGPPICVVLRIDPIIQYNLRFDTSITIGPDWDFLTQYAEVAQFGYINLDTCCYRIHQTNISFTVDSQKRSLDMAKCRMNAIKRPAFKTILPETREFVFYDLLTNLLRNFPDRQSAITLWPEFQELASYQQARLLRLMASKMIMARGACSYVPNWLDRSKELNPADRRGRILRLLYDSSPWFCKWFLRVKAIRELNRLDSSSFGDLETTALGHANRSIS